MLSRRDTGYAFFAVVVVVGPPMVVVVVVVVVEPAGLTLHSVCRYLA
jgi:hypothetical protein